MKEKAKEILNIFRNDEIERQREMGIFFERWGKSFKGEGAWAWAWGMSLDFMESEMD